MKKNLSFNLMVSNKKTNASRKSKFKIKVDPFKSDRGTNDLPATLYELEPNGELVQRSYIIESMEAERVC